MNDELKIRLRLVFEEGEPVQSPRLRAILSLARRLRVPFRLETKADGERNWSLLESRRYYADGGSRTVVRR